MCKTIILAAAGLCIACASQVRAENYEFRGVWVTRFEWTSPDPEKCRANITRIFETIAASNLNAAVFQIRGEAETLYPSTLEPWSSLLGGQDPGFDPVALAIQEAHRRGIAFHAYINPMPMQSLRGRRTSTASAPVAGNPLYQAHGPESAEPWVCVDADGKPGREEYFYMSAGVPDVHAYLRRVILDVVRRYDVDGIHLDRIRYPGPQYSHDAVSERRFRGRGNPNRREWTDWQREQLDKLINDLAAEIRAEKPYVVLSCAAWGIYNRHHIEGYGNFSSGYHDYFQDTWNWCRIGAMDVLMPMIYWNLPDPKPNYNELVADFIRGVGKDHFVGGQMVFTPDENAEEIRITREAGAWGTLLYAFRSAQSKGVLDRCRESLYPTKAFLPQMQRYTNPQSGVVLGTVTADDGSPLTDAWVSLAPADLGVQKRGGLARTWPSSADGRFAFMDVPPGPVYVSVYYAGAPKVRVGPVSVKAGETATADVVVAGAAEARDKPFLDIMAPDEGVRTGDKVAHLLGRTSPECRVDVAGTAVEVYSTGAFVRDGIPLAMGENTLTITATDPDGRIASHALTILRTESQAQSAPAQRRERTRRHPPAETQPAETVPTWVPGAVRIAETTAEETGITLGLHTVRLGGPYLARVPRGTRFEVVDKSGPNLKVRLAGSRCGWVPEKDVAWLPAGTAVPHNFFTACEVSGDEKLDKVSVSLKEKVVFAVTSETEPSNRLFVDFFNTHDALTWISHKSGAKVAGPVTGAQIEDDWFRLTIPLKGKQIWGYWTELDGNRLTLFIRRPPTIAEAPDSPLKGLLFALEAGHGGSGAGAVGHMGTKEKTINAEAVAQLKKALEQRGAKTVLVRPGDSEPSLRDRVVKANEAQADFFVSIHANAAGNSRGYLRVSGTSTYYKDKHCYLPADIVYRRLLGLNWNEFGVVGNFSYYPLQNTHVPGILIEQAFMSNPYDEARLLDVGYQQKQAKAVVEGIEEFFIRVKE